MKQIVPNTRQVRERKRSKPATTANEVDKPREERGRVSQASQYNETV